MTAIGSRQGQAVSIDLLLTTFSSKHMRRFEDVETFIFLSNGLAMEDALKKYILPDNMDGYTSVGSLIYDLERECDNDNPTENGLIAKEDFYSFKGMWEAAPADFVETIAVEWISTMEEIVKMEAEK